MCRLFAQISRKPKSAFQPLAGEETSLLKQADCNPKHLQKDGWGLATWMGNHWKTVKSTKPVYLEKTRFNRLAEKTESEILLAHIRHASNPGKLPREEVLGLSNTQPFTYKNLAFAHNGTLNIVKETARTLGRFKNNIRGANDSEVLFWLFVMIRQGGNGQAWLGTFKSLYGKIGSVWKGIPGRPRRFSSPWQGLNCIASDGKTLAALCCYDKPEGKALCGQGTPYFQMCYRQSQDKVEVASEPTEGSENWKPVPNKHVLMVPKNCRAVLRKLEI